jgi:predicted  nucleic acid-binding Zn-ribbon protein
MNSPTGSTHPELQALTAENEALLKSKSQLQQSLLQLKKEMAGKDQELKALRNQMEINGEQAAVYAEQASLIVVKDESIEALRQKNKQLLSSITLLEQKLRLLTDENTRLRKLTWFQKLLGKKVDPTL